MQYCNNAYVFVHIWVFGFVAYSSLLNTRISNFPLSLLVYSVRRPPARIRGARAYVRVMPQLVAAAVGRNGGSFRNGGSVSGGGGGGGGGGSGGTDHAFDRLTIADFDDDDGGKDDLTDLESVADLPDEPTNKSSAWGSSASAEPSAFRAVYTVPTVVNFQNWEASRRWDGSAPTPAAAAAAGSGPSGRTPILTRVLILKNVDTADHPAVVSAPLTAKFALVARGGGGGALKAGTRAPFELVLQPGASCTFDVHFFQPDDDELKFWDNFRDAVVIYTQR